MPHTEITFSIQRSPEGGYEAPPGKIVIADDFNDPLPKELEDLFW